MDQNLSDVFSPIELIEPTSLPSEFQPVLNQVVKCDKGYVCGGGSVEL